MPLIVLTGVNGFIGTNLCERLLSSTLDVLGFKSSNVLKFSEIDSKTHESWESQFKDEKNTVYIIGTDKQSSLINNTAKRFLGSVRYQYCDYQELFDMLEKLPIQPDIIVHNGACSSTTETDPKIFQTLNLEYSQKVWDYCTNKNIPLIYASSAAVYGNGDRGFSDRKEDCHKYKALNLYGQSKLDFDLWVLKQKRTPPTWFGLRYFNVFGPYENHKKGQASMVYHGYFQAVQTGTIKLFKSNTAEYEDGEQQRDFICVDDIVNVIKSLIKIAILRKRNLSDVILPENGIFLNLGTGVANTWNTLATSIFEALNLSVNISYIPIPENIADQYQNYTCADLSLFTTLNPNYSFYLFQDAVKRYINAYLIRGL